MCQHFKIVRSKGDNQKRKLICRVIEYGIFGEGHKIQPIRSKKALFFRFCLVEICDPSSIILYSIEYEIIGEGSQILTNQKRESIVSWLLIGRNLRPFPDNFVLYRAYLKKVLVTVNFGR